jgi:hypothetical protein
MKRGLLSLVLLLCTASSVFGQLISLKTVPIATGDQFMIFPSQNMAMGSVSIALDDPLLDPFVNPAKGAHLSTALLYSSPTFYSVGQENGSAKTVPLGGIVRSGRLFGGAALALQELRAPEWRQNWFVPWAEFDRMDMRPTWIPPQENLLSDQSATNLYAFGMLGTRLGARSALGASFFVSDLNRLEGIDLLYQNSSGIRQRGGIGNARLGFTTRSLSGAETEMVLLFNRVDMTHDVQYVEWVLDDEPNEEGWFDGSWQSRIEENLDISNTYGFHMQHAQFVGEGWRVGGLLTANYKTHPKIPNYDLMRIPRDPGNSRAFNFGLGVSRGYGRALFGVDIVYEPIWSDTWADTPEPLETDRGVILPAGAKTVENAFQFGNAAIRAGIARIGERLDVMLGLQIDAISYDLDQKNHITDVRRFQHEDWQEWTGSLGLVVKFPEFHIRYTGRVQTGTGRPGIANAFRGGAEMDFASADIVLAPEGALTLQETNVFTHQVTISIPVNPF